MKMTKLFNLFCSVFALFLLRAYLSISIIAVKVCELCIAGSAMIKLFILLAECLIDEMIYEFKMHIRHQFMFVQILKDVKFLTSLGLFAFGLIIHNNQKPHFWLQTLMFFS